MGCTRTRCARREVCWPCVGLGAISVTSGGAPPRAAHHDAGAGTAHVGKPRHLDARGRGQKREIMSQRCAETGEIAARQHLEQHDRTPKVLLSRELPWRRIRPPVGDGITRRLLRPSRRQRVHALMGPTQMPRLDPAVQLRIRDATPHRVGARQVVGGREETQFDGESLRPRGGGRHASSVTESAAACRGPVDNHRRWRLRTH